MTGGTHWPKSSLLGALGDASRERLLAQGVIREYPTDIPVIRMGDTTTFVIVILSGIVKATAHGPGGQEVLLAIRVGGDIVGEFAAMDEESRSATVTTCGQVSGCVIPRPAFTELLLSDGDLARQVDKSVLAKLRFANERRVDFASYKADARVARVLRELALAHGDQFGNRMLLNWPLTQTELASLASVAEPTVQKALRRLRDSGVISTGYRSLVIEDLSALDAAIGI